MATYDPRLVLLGELCYMPTSYDTTLSRENPDVLCVTLFIYLFFVLQLMTKKYQREMRTCKGLQGICLLLGIQLRKVV